MMNGTLSQKVNVTHCDDDTLELVGTRMFFGVFASLAVTEDADTASIPIAQSPLGFLALLSVTPYGTMDARLLVRWFFPSTGCSQLSLFHSLCIESHCKSQTDAKGD